MKTANLTGLALEWAVVKAHGWEPKIGHQGEDAIILYRTPNHSYWCRANYLTSQHHCVTLMEQEKICVDAGDGLYESPNKMWEAHLARHAPVLDTEEITGPTVLVAVYRCYVIHKLGEEIDIPKELQ